MNEESLQSPQVQGVMLLSIMKQLKSLEAKLDTKVAFLSVEEAVSSFLQHLREGISRRGKTFRNAESSYKHLMKEFGKTFQGRNLADVSASEVEEFLDQTWRDAKPSTLKQRQNQLHAFFEWSAKLLKKQGAVSFSNCCDLMTPIAVEVERPDFLPVKDMKKLLKRAEMPYRTIFELMACGGLRVSECLNLRKEDVAGRVLTIRSPKSGALKEYAVIPKKVRDNLYYYMSRRDPGELIFQVSGRSVLNAAHKAGKEFGIHLKNHSLRKWAISYWARKNEQGMEAFVSRHSAVTLKDRYVAPLTTDEAIETQKVMEEELYG